MKYYGLPCPVCGIVMNEHDDVVVCPECATPHHRECWFKNGRCINEELHSETFVWMPDSVTPENEPAAISPDDAKDEQATESETIRTDDGSIVCHVCGSENPDDAVHCGSCGALLGKTEEKEQVECTFCGAKNLKGALRCHTCGNFLSPDTGKSPFLDGVSDAENEIIGEYTVGDYALYTQLNAKRYVPKFRRIENGRVSFNWMAFLFGPKWFLFRKMYKIGTLLLVASVAVAMICAPLVNSHYKASADFMEQMTQLGFDAENPDLSSLFSEITADEEAAKQYEKIYWSYLLKSSLPMFGYAVIMLGERLLCGFLADKLYFKKVNADLKIIDAATEDASIRKMMIVRRGSVSFFAYFVGNLGEQALLSLFVMAADKLSSII